MTLTVGSLFSGIGGFDLGFERAGMRTLWFCEQDPFCQRVLARHWPGVPCHPDVRALVADTDCDVYGSEHYGAADYKQAAARRDIGRRTDSERRFAGDGGGGDARESTLPVPVPYVDVLCGGFPCQDISLAGRGAGLAGERSGLWREFARLIGELRPRYVVVENVPALTSRGLDVVLADLAACGFDAEWDHLPASAFGAPHRRDRIWIVAYSDGERLARAESVGQRDSEQQRSSNCGGSAEWSPLGHSDAERCPGRAGSGQDDSGRGQLAHTGGEVADAEHIGCTWRTCESSYSQGGTTYLESERSGVEWGRQWVAEPDVGRVATRVSARVDRLRALGNSLVPQIAEWIGTQIIEYEAGARKAAA